MPAIATAPLLLALLRSRWSALRPFVALYALGAAAAVGLVVLQAARGRSLADLLGAYSIVGEGGYDAGQVLRFWLWHVEELDLYVGIVPFVALLLALMVGRTLPDRLQEHVAATTALVLWSTLAVGTFASRFASDRVQDRYLFFLAPLLVVVLLAWVELGAPRPRVPLSPRQRSRWRSCSSSRTPGSSASPRSRTRSGWSRSGRSTSTSSPGATGRPSRSQASCSLALYLLVPARYAVAVPIVLLVLFAVLSRPVWSGPHGFVARGSARCGREIRAWHATGSTARCLRGRRSPCSGQAAPTASRST